MIEGGMEWNGISGNVKVRREVESVLNQAVAGA